MNALDERPGELSPDELHAPAQRRAAHLGTGPRVVDYQRGAWVSLEVPNLAAA
jgi:hypothetical protein